MKRKYTDSTGQQRTLYEMVRLEPEWAASRIREAERYAAWLTVIDGGDNPYGTVAQLREWARKALSTTEWPPGFEPED